LARETRIARLSKKTCISESAQCFHFEFEIEELESFDFAPGQFISTVAVDGNGKTQTRAYSIASAARGNRFSLCVNRVEGGFFSNHLADLVDLPVGATVQVHGPYGAFTLREPITDSIFVSTGTGIAPMLSFTQWLFPENELGEATGVDRSEGKEIWCVYGTRHESELYYKDYFERIAARHSNFHYICTLSRAPEDWTGLRGYVQQYVGEIVAKRGGGLYLPEDTPKAELPAFEIHTYICGLNNMVSAVRTLLAVNGWNKRQIIFERYD
jgi:ferredoxin-NADP reductase